MVDFLDIRFPIDLSIQAQGQISFRNENTQGEDGTVQSYANHDQPLRRWNASYGIKHFGDLETAVAFWEVVGGPEKAFKFRDPIDFGTAGWTENERNAITSTQQSLGFGDSTKTDFQCQLTYTISGSTLSFTRLITHPTTSTFIVEINGTTQSSTAYTLNELTGVVSFNTAVTNGHEVKAGFEFDIGAQFSEEDMPIDFENYRLGSARINIYETRSTTPEGL